MTFSVQAPRGVAEQFYLSAHDFKGNPQLAGRALELGAASAVFGELVISGFLEFSHERVLVCERGWIRLRSPLTNGRPTIVGLLLERISKAPAVAPRDWITDIAPNAPLWIARRLHAAGVVRPVMPSRLMFWRTAPRFVPHDLNDPHKLGDHIRLALQGRSSMTLQDVFLAGLLRATQLHRTRIGESPVLSARIAARVDALATSAHSPNSVRDNSLKVLLDLTEHLINTAVLAQTF